MEAKITDLLHEERLIEFTIKSRNTEGEEFEVKRTYEDMLWLHDSLAAKEAYIGIGIPSLPARPDLRVGYDYSFEIYVTEKYPNHQERIQNDFKSEYLAKFKKSVASYQLFLDRLIKIVSRDPALTAFLTFQQDLESRGPSTFDKLGNLLKKLKDSKVFLNKLKDTDNSMQELREGVTNYLSLMKEADKRHTEVSSRHINLSLTLLGAGMSAVPGSRGVFFRLKTLERGLCGNYDCLLVEGLVQASADLELMKNLLFQRYYFLVVFDEACRNLESARMRGKELGTMEADQSEARDKFDKVDESVRKEFKAWEEARANLLRENLVKFAQGQVEESKAYCSYLKSTLENIS